MKDEFVKKYLSLYKRSNLQLKFHVSGDSMLPLLKDGDYVSVQPSDRYKRGDMIVYESNTIVVHRIIETKNSLQGQLYITKGDNNFIKDPPVLKDEIVGKVVGIYHDGAKYSVKLDRFQRIMTLLSMFKWFHMGNNNFYKRIFNLKRIACWQNKVVRYFCKKNAISKKGRIQ